MRCLVLQAAVLIFVIIPIHVNLITGGLGCGRDKSQQLCMSTDPGGSISRRSPRPDRRTVSTFGYLLSKWESSAPSLIVGD